MDLDKFTRWKDRDFPKGSPARAAFDHLCNIECDPRLLFSLLTLSVLNAQSQRTIYDIYGVSRSALIKLPESLEEISRELESVNPLLGHYIQANFVENPNRPDQVRTHWRQQAAVYRTTPKLLRLLAGHLRVAEEWLHDTFGPKRFDTFRKSVLELLQYVDTCTGNPHYEEVADLLDHLSSVRQIGLKRIADGLLQAERTGARKKRDTTPKLLRSSDALKALYHRSAKYAFRKTRPAPSKPRSS